MAIERLSADDRLLMLSDPRWPQDVGVVAPLDGGALLDGSGRPSVEAAREAVARGLAGLPRLRQVLRVPPLGLGGPFWADDPSFDLDHHVRVATPLASREDTDLLEAVERIRRRRLDPSRPLWEVWLLPGPDDGTGDGTVAVFVRLHHVVADGVAGIATLASLLRAGSGESTAPTAPTAPAEPIVRWSPAPEPSRGHLFRDSMRRRARALDGVRAVVRRPREACASVADGWHGIRELVSGAPGPATSLGGLVGPHRRMAVVRASLDDVRAVARAQQVTVNDVLLAMIAGGVRALLSSRGEPVDGLVLPILVPVSLRRRSAGETPLGNRISQMAVDLPVGEADPVAGLRRIGAATSRAKAVPHPSMGAVFRNRLLSAVVLRLVIRRRINLLGADIVGPATPLSFAGATVREAFPLINLLGNVTLGVGGMSYAGRFGVLVVADADLYPDLDAFAAGAARTVSVLVGQAHGVGVGGA